MRLVSLARWTLGTIVLLSACDSTDGRVGSIEPHSGGASGQDAAAGAANRAGGEVASGGSGGYASSGGATAAGGMAATGGAQGTVGGGGSESAEAGAAGSEAGGEPGSGGTLPTAGVGGSAGGTAPEACAPRDVTSVDACLVGTDDELVSASLAVSVTVVSVGPAPSTARCAPSGQEIVLRAADAREWRYDVTLPGLPGDLVAAGDELELAVDVQRPFFPDQTVVLGRSGALLLFTKRSWVPDLPSLDDYGLTLSYGDPVCGSALFSCTGTEAPLLVTRASETLAVGPRQVESAFGLSFSVGATFTHDPTSFPCAQLDPPDDFRYGAFRLAN